MALADHVRVGREDDVRLEPHNFLGHRAGRVLHSIHRSVVKRQKRHIRDAQQLCRGECFLLADFNQLVAKERRIQRAHASVG